MTDQTQPNLSTLAASWDDGTPIADPWAGATEVVVEQEPTANLAPMDASRFAQLSAEDRKQLYPGYKPPKPQAQPRPRQDSVPIQNAPRSPRKPGQRLTEEQEHFILTAPGSLTKKAKALGVPRQTLQGVVRRAREIQEGVNLTHRCRCCQELLVCPTCGGVHE